MAGMKEHIRLRSADLKEEVRELRRHFHRHPELSYEENKTSLFISDWLTENSIIFKKGIAGTGIIGTIKGDGTGKRVIALRAEMDALPVTKRKHSDYSSHIRCNQCYS